MRMLRFIAVWYLLALAITATPAAADVAVPALTRRVIDLTKTLTETQIEAVSTRLKDLEDRKGSQIAVLMLPSVKPELIEQYAMRVAEAWKIGRRKIDDGLLIVIAKDDHHMRIEVGRGLEGAIPDITAGRVIDEEFTPSFKKGDYGTGITVGVDRLIRLIDGEPLPPPQKKERAGDGSSSADGDSSTMIMLFAAACVLIGAVLNRIFGHLPGSLTTGAGAGLVTSLIAGIPFGIMAAIAAFILAIMSNFILQAIIESGGSSSGGGFGGNSSGSNRPTGGGGSFGGGGASGNW